MNFWNIIKVVKSRKWIIAGVVAVTLLVIAIAAPRPEEVYQADAFMSPTPQVMQGSVAIDKEQSPVNPPNREVILSNLTILAQAGDVYQRAMDFLALPVNQQIQLAPDLPAYRQITRIETQTGELLTFKDWADMLEVAPVHNQLIGEKGTTTDIIRISVNIRDKNMAPYIANAVGQAFAWTYQDKSREDYRTYTRFLQSSKLEAKNKLHQMEKAIASYKQAHRVLAIDEETQSAIASLASLDAARATVAADANEAEAALRNVEAQLASQPLVSRLKLPTDMNPEVQKLQEELSVAEADLRMMAQRYKPAHEAYKAAQARVTVLRERIKKENAAYAPATLNEVHQDLVRKRSEAQLTLARARAELASINMSVARAQTRVDHIAKTQPELTELMTDYALAQKNYNNLSEKHAQALIAEKESTRTGSIVPYGWARAAIGPITQGPTQLALLLYGLVLSLIVGIMVAVWLDSIDNRMRNAADVEKLMELPVIGLTPQLAGRDGVLPKLTHLYPVSSMAESYKILRTNVLFELRDSPFKTLMVASGRPDQGATTTICNLAIALAQIGKRIILIDADMRRPSLHKFFDIPNDAGLSTLLQGSGNLTDALQTTEVENLIVVPAGPIPTNPSELLGSQRMREMVERLQEHCDLVLFDTPSAVVFSDGPMLASWVDAVLMVVSANQAPRGTEVRIRDLLKKAKANIIGVVVNRMSPDSVDSCYFYSQYYADSTPKADDTKLPDIKQPRSGKRTESSQPQAVASPALKSDQKQQSAEETTGDNPFPD